MKTEVSGIGLSIKLHYGIKEDLTGIGGTGDSGDVHLDQWSVGTRADILKVALELLASGDQNEVLVIGVVPSVKPVEGDLSASQVEKDTEFGPAH